MPTMRNHFHPKLVPAALTLAACLVASSCIDGDERIVIHRDGSGHASVSYLVPTAAVIAHGGRDQLRQTVLDWLDGNKKLDLETLELIEEDDRTRIHVELAFNSALSLIDLSSKEKLRKLPAAVRDLAGTLDFRLRGRRVELARAVHPRAALGGTLLLVPRSDLASHRLVYQISLPVAADSHNATTTRDNGRTLVWDYSLAEALDSPPEMHFAAKMPVPWWIWAAALLAVAIAATLIAAAIRRRTPRTATIYVRQ